MSYLYSHRDCDLDELEEGVEIANAGSIARNLPHIELGQPAVDFIPDPPAITVLDQSQQAAAMSVNSGPRSSSYHQSPQPASFKAHMPAS